MIRLALIGGSCESMIGSTHVAAASWVRADAKRADGRIEAKFVCGAFSRDNAVNIKTAAEYEVDAKRAYPSLEALLQAESQDSIDAVVIATPNKFHIPYALACGAAGFPVLCEKPMGYPVDRTKEVAELFEKKGLAFALAHHNTAWPAIEYLRKSIASGEIGEVRLVRGSYIQGWLAEKFEDQGNAQAKWRTSDDLSGPSCCFFDIGSHILNLGSYVTGEDPLYCNGSLGTFVEGRKLDDACQFTVRHGAAIGIYSASQVSVGYGNQIELSVDGEKGSFSWSRDKSMQLLWRNASGDVGTKDFSCDSWPDHLADFASRYRLEVENTFAFANLYQSFFSRMQNSESSELRGRDQSTGVYTAEILQSLLGGVL